MALNADSWHEERLLIDGKLVEAEGGATFDNINPANEEVIGVSADASKADLERAITAARREFDDSEWSATPRCGSGACASSTRPWSTTRTSSLTSRWPRWGRRGCSWAGRNWANH